MSLLPSKISQTVLDRAASATETVAIVILALGSGLGTFVVQGRTNKLFAFQFSPRRGAHVLRFPATLWAENKHALAVELFGHNVGVLLTPQVEPWDESRLLSDLVLAPLVPLEPEASPSPPSHDPAPTGAGLGVFVPPNEAELEVAREEGRKAYRAGESNPFDGSQSSPLADAWLEGFTEESAKSGSVGPLENPPAGLYRTEDGIFDGETKIAGFVDPDGHLRMSKGFADRRDEVEAFLEGSTD